MQYFQKFDSDYPVKCRTIDHAPRGSKRRYRQFLHERKGGLDISRKRAARMRVRTRHLVTTLKKVVIFSQVSA
jgi:hypothetical protein